MYYLNDKRAAVREVQKYLNSIYGASRHISESGFYDEGTKAAVIEFQKENDLLPTGAVNNETFSALYREYKRVNMRRAIKKSALTITFPIKRNDLTEEIRIISKKMASLLDYYGVYHTLRPSPIFTKEMEVCVRKLRQIYRLPGDDIIDEELYLRISEDYRRIFSEE